MTGYEILRQLSGPFLPVLHSRVHHLARNLTSTAGSGAADILDVGGRSSPYTVGLPARITVVDLPRRTEVQQRLGLGVDRGVADRLAARRSNVVDVVMEDFTRTSFDDRSFDIVLAIETLEHVEEDEQFVDEVTRVLRPGGAFLMTTPNGDYIRNEGDDYNPDHVRHYTRQDLTKLLNRTFGQVSVWYDIQTGKNRYRGLRSLQARHPARALSTLLSNVLSHIDSTGLEEQAERTAHLFGLCRKTATGASIHG